jgi:hypothetical protein
MSQDRSSPEPWIVDWVTTYGNARSGNGVGKVVKPLAAALFVALVLVVVLSAFGVRWLVPAGAMMLATGATIIALGVANASTRAQRALRQSHYQLCPGCGYPLKDLPSPGQCPECGAAFDNEAVERFWADYLEQSPHGRCRARQS